MEDLLCLRVCFDIVCVGSSAEEPGFKCVCSDGVRTHDFDWRRIVGGACIGGVLGFFDYECSFRVYCMGIPGAAWRPFAYGLGSTERLAWE